jgi:hypothetical protein
MEKLTDAERNTLMGRVPILAFFQFDHLPEKLRAVSEPLAAMAWEMAASLPASAELAAGLRKLLEAKDCFVRAKLTEIAPGKSHIKP